MKIMFVCYGNICRSPMAAYLLIKRAKELNKAIEVFSCGTHTINGSSPTRNAINTMKLYNVDLSCHLSQSIHQSSIEKMDLILCMTINRKKLVNQYYPNLYEKIYTLKEYVGFYDESTDILDPFLKSKATYKYCAKQISECIEVLLNTI